MTNLQSKSSSGVSNIKPPKNGTDLLKKLDKYSAPWQRLDIVEGTLQQCGPTPFVELLDIPKKGVLSSWQARHDPLFRALAIQAFSHIQVLEEKEEIASIKTDFSKNLLLVLQQEATSGATQLIRWSAAKTIKSIWFDPEWSRQNKPYFINAQFHINNTRIDGIENQITEQEVDQLSQLKNIARCSNTGSGHFSANYKQHLEFWVYGPSSVLFNLEHNSQEYQVFIEDVLGELQPRGIELGVDSTNNLVVELSLKFARDIFNDSDYFQWKISNCLKRFLNSDSEMQTYQPKALDFRKLAAESIVKLYPELWENDNDLKELKARAAVILQDWKLVEQLGEIAVFSLLEVGKGFLQLEVKPNLNLDIRVKAVGTIGKIKFKNDENKIRALCEFLQVPEEIIRYESALLLKPYFGKLQPKWHAIVTALLYQFNGLLSPSLDIISIEQIKQYIDDAKNDYRAINSIFAKASGYCEKDAFEVKNFFKQKLNECEKIINAHIEQLKGQISKIEKLQALVKQNAQRILSALKGIKLVCPEMYNQLMPLEKQAKHIKDAPLSSYSFNKAVESNKKLDSIKNSINSSLLKASQDLEKSLEQFIDDLDFTISAEIKTYIDNAGKEWEAIHKAFESASCFGGESIFDVDYSYFKEKFDKSQDNINAYLKTLNSQLLKIEKLQAAIKRNTELIVSTLNKTKSTDRELHHKLRDSEEQVQEISPIKGSSYSYKKIDDLKQRLAGIKNSIDSGLRQAIKKLEDKINQLSKSEKKLQIIFEENRDWWINFTITLGLFVLGLLLIWVLYLSDYGLAGELLGYSDSWQFRSDGLGAIFLSLLWLPFHVVLTWLFLLIYFAVVPLLFVGCALILLKGVVLLPKRIKGTFKIKRELAEAGLEARVKKQQDKLDTIKNILNELSNKWEYMK